MPNWCSNDIKFTSTRKSELVRLRKRMAHNSSQFSFNKIIPYPKVYDSLTKLSKMREARRGKEARKRGYDSYYDVPKQEQDEIEKRFPFIKNGYNEGGYKWCCDNWGTKWDSTEVNIEEIEKEGKIYSFEVSFETAWSPPIPVYIAIMKKYPKIDITAEYKEEGCNYEGFFETENGKITTEHSKEIV